MPRIETENTYFNNLLLQAGEKLVNAIREGVLYTSPDGDSRMIILSGSGQQVPKGWIKIGTDSKLYSEVLIQIGQIRERLKNKN